jgi:hypothetical protein
MDPDQPAQPRSLIRVHTVRLPTLIQEEKLTANSMDPDQTSRMRKQVWIHASRNPIMLFCRDTAHIKYLYDQAHAQLLPKYVSFLT